MKKSFTLIEVLISILILSITLISSLNIITNYKKLFSITDDTNKLEIYSSIKFIENKNRKNLYEELIDFKIKNDKIIHTLKQIELKKKFYTIFKQEFNLTNKTIKLKVEKIKIFNKFNSVYGYKFKIEGKKF